MVADSMNKPQPFLNEIQQWQVNKSMVPTRSSFGKDDVAKGKMEETPMARGVQLQTGNDSVAIEDTLHHRQSLKLGDLKKPPSSTTAKKVSFGPLASSERTESTESTVSSSSYSESDYDQGSVISADESAGGLSLYDSESSLLSPNKLYGRDKQVKKLTEAYKRIVQRNSPASPLEYILISGGVGSGKTKLGESLKQTVAEDGGFFCYGKFDQFNMVHPLAPMCAVFTDYAEQVLLSNEQVKNEARHRIRAAVDGDLRSICSMIPPLAQLMDISVAPVCPMKKKADTSSSAEQESTNKDDDDCKCKGQRMFAMQRLMRAISTPERPLVMMLDDLQWAKPAALDKIRSMITDDMNYGIVFVGVTYSNISPESDLSGMLRDLEDDRVQITNIGLKNLKLEPVINMVNDAFVMSEEQGNALGNYILENSHGNPYLVLESLKAIQSTPGLMHYDNESETWKMDIKACPCQTGCCPVNFIERKLNSLPRDMQKVFMVASCLGSNITPRLVEIALQEDSRKRFDKLVKNGKLIFDKATKTFSFKSNAVQQASYNLIDEKIRPGFHLEVGMRLWKNLSNEEVEENLFIIVDQIRRGVSLIDNSEQRYELAELVSRAATKAVGMFNFRCGSDLLGFAMSLLGKDHWEKAYDLSLTLYNYAAEVEFAYSDSPRVDELIEAVVQNARNFDDKFRAYSTRVYVLGGRGKPAEAIEVGLFVLDKLGIHLPKNCRTSSALARARIGRQLSNMSNERIKRMFHMTDPKKLAAMQILNLLFLNTKVSRQDLFPSVVLRMMKMTLSDGLSAMSSVAFAGYGSLLCYAGNVNEGLRYGKLALDLLEDFGAVSFMARVDALVWGEIYPHVRPWADSLEKLKEGHRIGLQTGDISFAKSNADVYILFLLQSGSVGVKDMVAAMSDIAEATKLHGHPQNVSTSVPFGW